MYLHMQPWLGLSLTIQSVIICMIFCVLITAIGKVAIDCYIRNIVLR